MEIDTTFKLKQAFSTILSNFRIIYLQESEVYCSGSFRLDTFIENLSRLKVEDLEVYTFLMTNHKDTIDSTKKLLVRLKLLDLPIPYVTINYSGYCDNRQKPPTQPHISIDGYSVWRYFFNFYDTHHWVEGTGNRPDVVAEEERYLSKVWNPLTDISEAITATIFHYLADAHEKGNT